MYTLTLIVSLCEVIAVLSAGNVGTFMSNVRLTGVQECEYEYKMEILVGRIVTVECEAETVIE